ncbi:MAG: HD domain-containing phosphohydrolase [Bacillus sp. (in: firmicutes)]
MQQLPLRLKVFLHLADAVLITDSNHTIVEVNQEYERITGYDRNAVIGLNAGFLKSSLTPSSTYTSLENALNECKPWSGVLLNKKKCGGLWHASLTITPMREKEEIYYIGTFRELEQLKQGVYIPESEKISTERELLRVLAISCEIRDPGIEQHLLNVQRLTEQLVASFSTKNNQCLSLPYLYQIIHASILHDIGKAGIPEGILYRPGPLTEYERKIIEMHPLIGMDILSKISTGLHLEFIKSLKVAENIIKYHHERWDGTGYPYRLEGENIPFEARVVAIVDVFDALVSRRAYKDSWTVEQSLAFIKSQRGKQFDPMLVDAFIELF